MGDRTTDDALALIDAVRTACRDGGGRDPLDEATWLHLKHHGLEHARLATADAGFALVIDRSLDLAVAPGSRGEGVGGRLLSEALVHGPATAWSHGDHPAAVRLADRHGWVRARELWVMRRPLTTALPELPAPQRSDDVVVRSLRAEDPDEIDAVLAVNAAAFAHHPEQGSLDRAGMAERMAEEWFDPSGLLVAVDAAGRVLGFHWTKRHSPTLGEVYVVGISPAAQGRGLGRLLTLAGLHHLARQGLDEVHLYVESDNTAALATYSGLGFTHAASDTHVQYRRPD